MALIFPRLAHNFVKNGYYPTDSATISGITSALSVRSEHVRLADPCCGEGAALRDVAEYLKHIGATKLQSFGIEVDAERAWHAKTQLDVVAHADVHDVMVSARSLGLLFLNPPYGDVVSDKAGLGDTGKRERHEKIFARRTFQLLQFGGVLVLIIPFYVLDLELATLIARNFDRIEAFMAPEQQFKQAVVFGVKRRSSTPDSKVVQMLEAFGKGDGHVTLPDVWPGEPYEIPEPGPEPMTFTVARLEANQLSQELARLRTSTLWPRFNQVIRTDTTSTRRPLRSLTRWHLALALAAGQISGMVSSSDGRRFLVKGDTFKEKERKREYETDADGTVRETLIDTDKFIPAIRAIDFTPGPSYGSIVTIR